MDLRIKRQSSRHPGRFTKVFQQGVYQFQVQQPNGHSPIIPSVTGNVCGFQIQLLNMPIHLKTALPL